MNFICVRLFAVGNNYAIDCLHLSFIGMWNISFIIMWPLHNQSYCNISMKNRSNVIICIFFFLDVTVNLLHNLSHTHKCHVQIFTLYFSINDNFCQIKFIVYIPWININDQNHFHLTVSSWLVIENILYEDGITTYQLKLYKTYYQ